jgi:hypothetical protein
MSKMLAEALSFTTALPLFYYCFTQVVAMSNMLAEALAEEDNLLGIARSTSV